MSIIIDAFSTFMIVLYGALGESVILAIVVFTVLVRLALMPLTLRSQRSMKRMQELSPKLRELQEKYKDDRQRLAQEQMNLYREQGINPFAGCLPVLIQLPIIFSMWRVIIATLASTPQQMLDLQNRLLISGLDHLVPMKNTFLWLNLSLPDPYFVLPILVVVTSYLQQKLVMPVMPKPKPRKPGEPPDPNEQAQQITRQMTTFMPLMVGFFALTYASGLSIYFIVSNIFGIIQYVALGKADWRRLIGKETPKPEPALTSAIADVALTADETPEAQVVAQATAKVSARRERELRPGISVVTLKPEPATKPSKPAAVKKDAAKPTASANKAKATAGKSKKR